MTQCPAGVSRRLKVEVSRSERSLYQDEVVALSKELFSLLTG